MVACCVKVIRNCFENFELDQSTSIQYDYIYKTCVKVFRHINYRRNTVEMALFRKHEVSC